MINALFVVTAASLLVSAQSPREALPHSEHSLVNPSSSTALASSATKEKGKIEPSAAVANNLVIKAESDTTKSSSGSSQASDSSKTKDASESKESKSSLKSEEKASKSESKESSKEEKSAMATSTHAKNSTTETHSTKEASSKTTSKHSDKSKNIAGISGISAGPVVAALFALL